MLYVLVLVMLVFLMEANRKQLLFISVYVYHLIIKTMNSKDKYFLITFFSRNVVQFHCYLYTTIS